MNYWVIKGRPSENPGFAWLRANRLHRWHTAKPLPDWHRGDRVFLWRAAPSLRMIGLAELDRASDGFDEDGEFQFRLKYLTNPLDKQPTISELRRMPALSGASFLKSGPAGVVFPLSPEQGAAIYGRIVSLNHAVGTLWADIDSRFVPVEVLDDLDLDPERYSSDEGRQQWVRHLSRERNRALVARKKDAVRRALGWLECEACGFRSTSLAELGEACIEAHHKRALSAEEGVRQTELRDLALLCSNCHRILHHTSPMWSVAKLASWLREA